ncbi:hypothetical protein BC830DRAFT_1118854 [Chytriomyces sp. MP71]|nr:hypothetical protein BC830DRAFT_1118854 [Chytriomyces sp. MP71]
MVSKATEAKSAKEITEPATSTKASGLSSTWLMAAAAVVVLAAAMFFYQSPTTDIAQSKLSDRSTRFIDWMRAKGIDHSGTRIVELGGENRDVLASAEFRIDDIVMKVPHTATVHDALAKETDPNVAAYVRKYPKTDWVSIIAAYILLNRNNPQWKDYFDFLPAQFYTPIYWSAEELELLKGTDLGMDVERLRDEIQGEWHQWQAFVPQPFTLESFIWAWHCVMSRAWTLPVGDGRNKAVLIPMVDVANHHGKPKVKIEYNKKLGAVTMTATQSISPEDQIDVTYGDDSSYKLLKYMGFTIPDNDHNEDCRVRIFREGADPPAYHIPRRWCLFHVNKLDRTLRDCHLGVPMDWAVLRRVLTAVQEKERGYPTTVEEDEALLAEAVHSFNFVNAVRERRGEKACLRAVATRLDKVLKPKK